MILFVAVIIETEGKIMDGNILSIGTFILGVAFSYIIARSIEVKTNITVKFQHIGIINNDLKGVEFSCNGYKVDTLTKTSILFWNSGNKCIKKEQLLNEEFLHFVFPENCIIFSGKIMKTTDDAINLDCKVDKNNIFIDFTYLKKGDGGLIEVLHNSDNYEKIEAKIKLDTNQKNDVVIYKQSTDWFTADKEKSFKRKIFKISLVTMSILVMLMLSIGVFAFSFILEEAIGDLSLIVFIIGEWGVGFLSSQIVKIIAKSIVNIPDKLR